MQWIHAYLYRWKQKINVHKFLVLKNALKGACKLASLGRYISGAPVLCVMRFLQWPGGRRRVLPCGAASLLQLKCGWRIQRYTKPIAVEETEGTQDGTFLWYFQRREAPLRDLRWGPSAYVFFDATAIALLLFNLRKRWECKKFSHSIWCLTTSSSWKLERLGDGAELTASGPDHTTGRVLAFSFYSRSDYIGTLHQ
jgi:hypothetical protein